MVFGMVGCTFPWADTEKPIVEDAIHEVDEEVTHYKHTHHDVKPHTHHRHK